MSKGSGMGERILFGRLAKCNQELACGPKFCFHRQNLLGYFQNLWKAHTMISEGHVVNVVATGSPQDESVQCADLWPVSRKNGPHGGRPTGRWLQRFVVAISLSILLV